MSKNIVELTGVNKIYGTNHVVKDLNLTVEEGEFLTLLGSSGCGKTTTLRMIAGFEEPTSGSVKVEGQSIEEKEPYERDVNTVFQSYALFPHKTIFDNIAYGLKMKKVPKKEIAVRVKEMMELVQLEGFEKRFPSQLSGGQKQRVAIARALINRPKVLLLDEPLGALDLKLRKQMQLELKRLQKKLNITFIYVTHDQEEALTMSDKVVVMSDGMIQQIGTPEEIYNEPNTVFVADFIGDSNIFNGKMTGKKKVKFCGANFECVDDMPVGANVDVVIRPEDIIMTKPEEGTITGTVASLIFKGMHYEIIVESGVYEIVIQSTKCVQVGETIGMCLDPDGIHVIMAETNHNEFDGELTKNYTVLFADGEFECDVTKLYPGSHMSEDGCLLDADGSEINTAGVKVDVKIPVDAVSMSDDVNAGGTCGNIISLIYKGDHYHYIVRTKSEEDIHLHDDYLWNEEDYVSIVIPKEAIELTLKADA